VVPNHDFFEFLGILFRHLFSDGRTLKNQCFASTKHWFSRIEAYRKCFKKWAGNRYFSVKRGNEKRIDFHQLFYQFCCLFFVVFWTSFGTCLAHWGGN
jgi:hypothetical protein